MTQRDKCYVLLSKGIQELARNISKQFLGIAQLIKAVDEKLESLANTVQELGAIVVNVKKDACWNKDYLEKEAESDEKSDSGSEKEGDKAEK